jgi:hypothetical protein
MAWVLASAIALHGATGFSSTEPLRLQKATPTTASVACYGAWEAALDLRATFDNPFDPADIDVYALFTSPQGQTFRVNGFYDQVFTRKLDHGAEKIEPAGEPGWKLRFTPSRAGRWGYEVFAKDRSGTARLEPAFFEVTPSANPGFIRRATSGAPYFMRDNGQPFFPIGENMGWAGGRGTYDYEDWLGALGKAGGNFIRVWMSSWNCALEWTSDNKGDWRSGQYHNLGVYSLQNAWKLDFIFDLAEQNGISLMLCLGTYGELKDGGFFNEGQWKANPYNATNGGPCAKAGALWTNETARKLYQRRLRYLGARYGHRVNLQSWEFWNEAEAPAPWVAEMARCLKGAGEFTGHGADPYGHLVTTTYGNPEVWNLPEIDITQTHSYGVGDLPDQGPKIYQEGRRHAAFGKPHLMAEFGIDWRSPDSQYDPDGKAINFHNALWASLLSGDAGGAMIWWWDNYVHPKKLYAPFTALRKFADTVPWTLGHWQPLAIQPLGLDPNATNKVFNGYALGNGSQAIAWIQNARHHWKNAFEKQAVSATPKARMQVSGLPAGRYRLEWWDTYRGTPLRAENVSCEGGNLQFELPELAADVAIQLTPATP